MAVSSIHRGFRYEPASSRLSIYYNGTRITNITASGMAVENGALTVNTSITATTGAITATAGNIVATAGNIVATAGDFTATVGSFVGPTGNVEIGTPGAFGTTQPQGAVVMGGTSLTGIAPAGAIATAGAVFASDTVVRKIIADGTASNVET